MVSERLSAVARLLSPCRGQPLVVSLDVAARMLGVTRAAFRRLMKRHLVQAMRSGVSLAEVLRVQAEIRPPSRTASPIRRTRRRR